jgi:aspartyl/asparaginyl beta-hydroxylase (cupin superfamily)
VFEAGDAHILDLDHQIQQEYQIMPTAVYAESSHARWNRDKSMWYKSKYPSFAFANCPYTES